MTASTYDSRGDFTTARRWHEWALQSARQWPRPQQHCVALTFFLWHLNATQNTQRTHQLGQEALSLGQFSMTPYIHNSLGAAALQRGEPELALAYFRPQLQHTGTLQLVAIIKSALASHQLGATEQAHALLNGSEASAIHNEDGRAHFEWAVAALTIDPALYLPRAVAMVYGQTTNDFVIVQRYRRLIAHLQREHNLN